MMDLNLKLQATSTKSLSKAIDFELRKEHAIEAEEQLSIVKVIPKMIKESLTIGLPPRFI
jgi:Dynein associated protein